MIRTLRSVPILFGFALALASRGAAQTISSATNQSFRVGDPITQIATITITDDAVTPVIIAGTDLRVRIPAGFAMSWDTADVAATIGGSAAAKVDGTVLYEDGGATLVLDVTSDFTAGEEITVSDLSFTNFTAVSAVDHLQLEVHDDDAVSAVDDKTITIDPQSADLAVVKTVDVANPSEGATVVFTVALSNAGPNDATNVQVTDLLPSGLTFVSATTTQGSYSSLTGAWDIAAVTTTVADSLVITATVDLGTGGSEIVNAAAVTASDLADGNAANDSDEASIMVQSGPPTISSAADQGFPINAASTPIATITIAAPRGPSATAEDDLRVRIPAGFPMVWDATDATAALGGSAAARVDSAVTFEDAGATLVLDVLTDFAPQDTLTISGLSFAGFAAAAAPVHLELEIQNDDVVTALDDKTVAIGAPTISSAVWQNFVVGGEFVPNRAITITDDAVTPTITVARDIRIRIPASLAMTWFETDSVAVLGGSAAAKVSTIVSYEAANRTVVLHVGTDFAAGDILTIDGLRFANFTAPSAAPEHLELDVGASGGVTALDDETLTILPALATRSSALAVTRDGEELWVANPDHGSVAVIDVLGSGDNTLLAQIPVARETWSLAIHPTNGEVWVTSQRDDHVYILDRATRAVVDSMAAGFETFGVAFDPSGMTALVTASGSDQLLVIDVPTRTVTRTLSTYRRPRGIAWRPDARRARVTHLLMPEFFGRLSTYFPSTGTIAEILIQQLFLPVYGGYPSTMQNITVAPPPFDNILWIPSNMINTAAGAIAGNPLTPMNIFHATIRPVNATTSVDLRNSTFFLSEGGSPNSGFPGGTPVGGPIAVDFSGGHAYIANLHSENVTVVDEDILTPHEVGVIPAGRGPIGIAAHPSRPRVYVANWLSRSVTVIDTGTNTVVTTVPSATTEVLPTSILHGKQLFFTSTGNLSLDGRGSCASCHVWGKSDARPWDLTQFGKHIRATPDMRGIGFTGAHDWTGDKNEMQDHNFGIIEFTGGAGLIPGGGNPPLGPPNAGLSGDLDDLARFMATMIHRTDTPFLNPDGSLTAQADSGRTLFNDPVVACATCHVPPFFTDSRLAMPFIKHDVGTADASDTDAAAGFDTPSLIGVWDTAPYLHSSFPNTTLEAVLTTLNPNDQHGTTSQLAPAQIAQLVAYLKSIAWPESTGTPVAAPITIGGPSRDSFDDVFPNPFAEQTSFRFALERNSSQARIEIFDVSGRSVRTLLKRPLPRGAHVVGWDARNDDGRPVAAGFYYARLTVDGVAKGGKKMIVLR